MASLTEIADTIRQRLNALAAAHHKSPTEMSRAMQITEGQLLRIYRGEASISAVQLVLAAQELGVNSSVITGELKYDATAQSGGDGIK